MATGNLNVTNNVFDQSFTLDKQNTIITLSTTGTYLNKDIKLTNAVRSANVSLAANSSASISSLTYTYNSSAGNFTVAGSASLTGTATLSVSQSGWIGSNVNKAISGAASLSGVTVPKVGVKSTLGGATSARKPTISKQATPTGVTNAASGDASTTAPSSGVYVAVKSATNTAAITATAAVSSTGYGTTTDYTATHASATVGAAASDMTYIPITIGSLSLGNTTITSNPTISVCATNGLITASQSGSKAVSPTVTAGWISSSVTATISTSGSNTSQMTTKGATTYNTSSSDQTIAAGTYLTGLQTIKAVTTSNIDAANIKYNVVVKVGDANNTGRIKTVTGTFTSTVSTGQTKIDAAKILSGYSGYIDGTEIKGNIATKNSDNLTASGATVYVPAGYFAATATKAIAAGSAKTPATTISKAPTISMTTATGVITVSYTASQSITPTVSAGYISSGTAGTVSTSGINSITLGAAPMSISGRNVYIGVGWVGTTATKSVSTTQMSYTVTSVSSNNAISRGQASWGTGWITSGSIAPASFSNSGTANVTYIDISNTTDAPVLVSGDYLYINAGYNDNLKISLAKLVPDGASASLAAGHILSGYSAYNNNGVLVAGNIPTKTSANLTASGATVYVPAGYFAATATKAISAGAYSAGIGLTQVTVTPSIGLTSGATATYGLTTTKPSGSDGVEFITFDPQANAPSYSATGTASITTAGYLSTGNKYSGTSKTVSVNDGTNYYVPIVAATVSGGGLSTSTNTNTIATTPVVTVSSSGTFKSASSYGVTTTQPSGTDGTNYLTIDGSGSVTTTGKATSTVKVSRAAVTLTNSAGVIAANNGVTKIASTDTGNITKDVNITPTVTDSFAPLYIPIVSVSLGGNGLSVNTNTNTVSTNPVVTISSSGTFKSASTYGVTTTQPSGTDGTNYLTIDGSGTVSTTGVITSSVKFTRATATYTNSAGAIIVHSGTAGMNATSSTTGTTVKVTPTVTDSFAPLYIPITSVSFGGGSVSKTNYSGKPVITMAVGGDTNMANATATTAKDTSNYPYYFKVKSNTDALSGSTNVKVTARTYSVGAGAIKAASGNALGAVDQSPTVSVSAADEKGMYVGLKKATMTVSGTNTVSPSASVAGTNATLNTTDNGIQVTATGGGTASVTAKATTNAAGYAPASTELGSATLNAANKTTTASKYIAGVTLNTGAANRTFTVTAPSGGVNHTYTFTQLTTGRTTIKIDNTLTMEWNETTQSLDFIYT